MIGLRWAAVLAVLLLPAPVTADSADLQVINTVPEGTLRFFVPVHNLGYMVVLGPFHDTKRNSYYGPFLLNTNLARGKVLWVDDSSGFIKCEPLEGADNLPLFGVIPVEAHVDEETGDIVFELYGIDYADYERRFDLLLHNERLSPEELREAVYRVTIRWNTADEWKVERVEKVVDLPLGYEVSGDGLYDPGYRDDPDDDSLLIPVRREDGRYVILKVNLSDGHAEELLELPLKSDPERPEYWLATRYRPAGSYYAVWDVYGDPSMKSLLVAWVDGRTLKYAIYDCGSGNLLREGSVGLDFEPAHLEIYGPFVLVSDTFDIGSIMSSVKGKVYLLSCEGAREVFSGHICSMLHSALSYDCPHILVGGEGVWGVWVIGTGTWRAWTISDIEAYGFEDPEHLYWVLAPGIVVFCERGSSCYDGVWGRVVPRIEAPQVVEEGTRVIELGGPGVDVSVVDVLVYKLTDSGREYYTSGNVESCHIAGWEIRLEKPLEEGNYELELRLMVKSPRTFGFGPMTVRTPLKVTKKKGLPAIPVVVVPRGRRVRP